MGASTETEKLTTEDLVARLKKKLVAERKRRAKFEQQLKTGAGNRMVQAAIRMNNAAAAFVSWICCRAATCQWLSPPSAPALLSLQASTFEICFTEETSKIKAK